MTTNLEIKKILKAALILCSIAIIVWWREKIYRKWYDQVYQSINYTGRGNLKVKKITK